MFYVYIEKENSFAADMVGEYSTIEAAQDRVKREKDKDSKISYRIEESSGGFNSYGELLTDVVEEG